MSTTENYAENEQQSDRIDHRTLTLLEFEKIRREVADYCFSEEGRDRVLGERFTADQEELQHRQELVAQARRAVEREDFPSLEFPPIAEPLQRVRTEGAVLEGEELFAIARYILSGTRLRRFFTSLEEEENITETAREIPDESELAGHITAVLEPDGSVKESHPELKELRRTLSRLRSEVNELAGRYFRSSDKYWQSTVPSERDGRVVLPVKTNYRGQVPGVVHYVSARGTTVYIEPPDMLEKNNDIAMTQYKIEAVILRILRELSERVRSRWEELSALTESVAMLDAIICRAAYGMHHRCVRAGCRQNGFRLVKARHPLLRDAAVPIDIETKEDVRGVIITGPNAGGKTVTLKTVGLFVLMNQFGMQIPAAEGTELSLYEGVFADIGDEQSIESSISTFSGHMEGIARVLDWASGKSLVLLDELGSGTDPGEGAALAMGILDEFLARGCTVIVTSHHGLLKNYGYTTEAVENASMDFDDSTLSPTYKVVPGLPGESHALDIARRSGISGEIVSRARSYMTDEYGEVGKMIRELERKQKELAERDEELRAAEQALERRASEVEEDRRKLREREHQLREEGHVELSRFLKESRSRLENLVRELQEGRLSREKTKEVKDFIEEVQQRQEAEEKKLEEEEAAHEEQTPVELQEGMEVLTGPGRRRGTLLRREKKGRWLVQIGPMKVSMAERDLQPAGQEKAAQRSKDVQVSYSSESGGDAPSFTLDIRGERLDKALERLSRQLDEAVLSGLREFQIIHGKGTGALQKGVHDFLSSAPQVRHYAFSPPEEGGTGKTYVQLKEG
jgi:DNA mismatch repair protein MutS2